MALEASRACAAWVQLRAATVALVTAQRVRQQGRGRRPSTQQIERLARRQGLADGSYSQALDKLRELAAARRNGRSVDELLRQVMADEASDGG